MAAADEASGAGPPLLSRRPEEGARLLALSFLDQAAAARPRLDDPEDSEALHDFRVALRRLRSCLRAYRDHLGDGVPKKLQKRLRRLADATTPGRDTEVQIEWLRGQGKDLAGAHHPGKSWLLGRLEEKKRAAYEEIQREVAEEFAGVEADLRRALSVYRAEIDLGGKAPLPTLGEATAEILTRQVEDLADHLDRIDGPDDERQAHRARIAAKRLRYLIEPWKGEVPGVEEVIHRMKDLQDLLGELHDAHVLAGELEGFLGHAAAERVGRLLALTLSAAPDPARLAAERRRRHEPGILALAQRNRKRRDELFGQVKEEWLDGRAKDFLAEVKALRPALRRAAGAAEEGEGSA
jgi:CHAD domain-containing protein